jgi:peptide/nickel transport system substrate-binding protein
MFVQYGGMQPFIDAIVAAGMGIDPAAHVEEGQALIEAAGWAKNADGIYEKDGQTLSAPILVSNSTAEYTRTTDVIVEQLIAAGIDASSQPVTDATITQARNNGDFVAAYNWDACGSVNEPWNSMNRFTTHFVVPTGQLSPGGNNYVRWNTSGTEAYTAIVDQIGVLPLGDPQIVGLVVDAYQYIYNETPFIPLVQAAKLVPFDTTYWTNWPTAENNYNHPATWWNSTEQIILNLHKAGGS